MKILVTGAAGFIGSYFVKRQLESNPLNISEIIVVDKLTYAGNLNNFTQKQRELFIFIEGDICDPDVTFSKIKEVDCVVNFAAESHVDRSLVNASNFVRSNTLGAQVLLENCRLQDVGKFVQVSTDVGCPNHLPSSQPQRRIGTISANRSHLSERYGHGAAVRMCEC